MVQTGKGNRQGHIDTFDFKLQNIEQIHTLMINDNY